ncbi:MAG: DUF4317 family protein [Eubacteriales bacterium]|nr:DUF4317 family protein [Eubacteriales bacterium]
MINREDMLELTRRMTPARTCLDRIAGGYMDRDGELDGSFNVHFLKLSGKEKERNLAIAKTVPFSRTNEQLKEYCFAPGSLQPGGIRQLLTAMRECGLKNDALNETFYELVGERFRAAKDYAVFLFHGVYDVPRKASDKESLWESEEVYDFLICTVGPLSGEYEPGKPEWGFLFPAFSDRSADEQRIDVFCEAPGLSCAALTEELLGLKR